MLIYFPSFKRNGAHLVEKKDVWKKIKIVHFQGLSALNMQKHFWFVSNFEHVNFAIKGTYSKKNYDIPNYYVHLWSFKHTKMQF
jgi:hypothetical protein